VHLAHFHHIADIELGRDLDHSAFKSGNIAARFPRASTPYAMPANKSVSTAPLGGG
jgi:hypothetical protein